MPQEIMIMSVAEEREAVNNNARESVDPVPVQ